MGATLDALCRLQEVELQIAELQRGIERKRRVVRRHEKRIADLDRDIQARRKAIQSDQVEADTVEFTNYTGRRQQMQMRKPAFHPGTRVLLVDQWIETGGTMEGAIALIERQDGIVAGVAAVCIEENERTHRLRERYQCSSAVRPGTPIQDQCNRQTLDSFATYTPEQSFPSIPKGE